MADMKSVHDNLSPGAGAALNDAGLPVGASSTGRPVAEFISENPQDSEIAAIPCADTLFAAKAAPTTGKSDENL